MRRSALLVSSPASRRAPAIVTATIGTAPNTLTQNVNVTVSQGASISIAAVNAGATSGTVPGCSGTAGLPVVLANVNCQIDVVLNLSAGVQPLDSLVIYIQRGTAAAGAPTFQGKAAPVCAAASAPCAFYKLAAKQNYGNTIPSTGPVSLSIFTQNFAKNATTGVAVVDYYDGPTSLISQLFPHNVAGGAVTDCQIAAGDAACAVVGSMVFTNADGWAADIGRCETANTFPGPACAAPVLSVVAPGGTNASTGGFAIGAATGGNVSTTGTTFTGGPTNSGMTVAELYPVVYNDNARPSRQVRRSIAAITPAATARAASRRSLGRSALRTLPSRSFRVRRSLVRTAATSPTPMLVSASRRRPRSRSSSASAAARARTSIRALATRTSPRFVITSRWHRPRLSASAPPARRSMA